VDLRHFLFVGLGGFLGANTRYLFAGATARLSRFGSPAGTLIVNATGSLLLGVFLTWAAARADLPERTRLLIGTGFFGSYTTFSTFANESFLFFDGVGGTLMYILLMNVLCLAGAALGLWLGGQL